LREQPPRPRRGRRPPMGRVPQLVERGKKDRRMGEPRGMAWEEIEGLELDARIELIRELIPLGLAEVGRMLTKEVERLAGPRHRRKARATEPYRHGSNPGSVRLGGQRHPVRVPRVRGEQGEVRLATYERLHGAAGEVDDGLFRKVLLGISCRDYEAAVEAVPGAIGLSKSTVSREFTKATARKLKAFQERDLSEHDVVAVFLDGKTFAEDEMVIALGVTMTGDKHFLGFVQTETENARAITAFLRSLLERGLDLSAGALVVLDGAKGLKAGVNKVFRGQVLIQRCQWHKRENVVSYLPRTEQRTWRRRLQHAYQRPTYEEAKQELTTIRSELDEVNQSAVASLDEGFEDTLTLHRLGVFALLGRSLKTTNVLESVNAQAEQRCGRVDHWKNSNQKQRWLAAALLDIEPRLRRLLGYRHLPLLRAAIQKNLGITSPDGAVQSAA
jgi:putative transposase